MNSSLDALQRLAQFMKLKLTKPMRALAILLAVLDVALFAAIPFASPRVGGGIIFALLGPLFVLTALAWLHRE